MNDGAEVDEGGELICSMSCSIGGDITEFEINPREEDISSEGDTDRLVSETALRIDRPFSSDKRIKIVRKI